jgi:hypothetical protein
MKQQLRHDEKTQTVILCCGSKRCPELKIEDDQVTITDDYGQKINISKEQASLIPQALEMLSDKPTDA